MIKKFVVVLAFECNIVHESNLFTSMAINEHIALQLKNLQACFLIIGDAMRSLQLLLLKSEDGTAKRLELRARDYDPAQLTACKILDENVYMAADTSMNLLTMRKIDAATDEERVRLEHCGSFHLGQFVNAIHQGSLVMKQEERTRNIPTFLAAGVEGSVIFIAALPKADFQKLESLQRALHGVINGVGGLDHIHWRSPFSAFRTSNRPFGFIDGDCLEAILDASETVKENVRTAMLSEDPDLDFDELLDIVEDLSRLH